MGDFIIELCDPDEMSLDSKRLCSFCPDPENRGQSHKILRINPASAATTYSFVLCEVCYIRIINEMGIHIGEELPLLLHHDKIKTVDGYGRTYGKTER